MHGQAHTCFKYPFAWDDGTGLCNNPKHRHAPCLLKISQVDVLWELFTRYQTITVEQRQILPSFLQDRPSPTPGSIPVLISAINTSLIGEHGPRTRTCQQANAPNNFSEVQPDKADSEATGQLSLHHHVQPNTMAQNPRLTLAKLPSFNPEYIAGLLHSSNSYIGNNRNYVYHHLQLQAGQFIDRKYL